MWHKQSLSLVLPAYNEAGSIARAVCDFVSTGLVDEILVIDNNSTDGTAKEVEGLPARVIPEPRQGCGFAIRRGMKEAKGELVAIVEPDATYEASDLIRLLERIDQYEIVCGTRTNLSMIDPDAHMPWYLRWGNIVAAKLLQFLFWGGQAKITDCGCIYIVIRREALQRFLGHLTAGGGYLVPEVLIQAALQGMRLIETPVHFHRRIGQSKYTGTFQGVLVNGVKVFWIILSYWFKYKLLKCPL